MARKSKTAPTTKRRLRSQLWFDNTDNPGMTALYLERYLNFGLTLAELTLRQADHRHRPDRLRPVAVQPSSSRACQTRARRHPHRGRHRVRISDAPDPGNRQAADRGARPQPRLSWPRRSAVRLSARRRRAHHRLRQDHAGRDHGGRDREHSGDRAFGRPDAQRLVEGRALRLRHCRCGARARPMPPARIGYHEFIDIVASSAPSIGHCNTMGTASTMNALAEALGMSLPGCAAIPAPYRERGQIAYETGVRAVEIVHEDLKPSDILTRKAFENAIVANSAIGGSTNAPIHINAIARHVGVELTIKDWETLRLRRAAARQHAAGGQISRRRLLPCRRPARGDARTARRRRIHGDALTINGKTMGENVKRAKAQDADVIRPYDKPLKTQAGFKVLHGQPVRFRDHEDERDLAGIPRALSVEPEGPECVRRPRGGVRWSGGLSPPHRRSRAEDRREHHAVRARRRADRLSGLGRGREHAAARGADQKRHQVAADASATAGSRARRARPRSSMPRRRRPRAAAWRCSRPATACASISTRAPPTFWFPKRNLPRAARRSTSAAASPTRQARRHGRKSSAAWSTSLPTAWC